MVKRSVREDGIAGMNQFLAQLILLVWLGLGSIMWFKVSVGDRLVERIIVTICFPLVFICLFAAGVALCGLFYFLVRTAFGV